MSENGEKQNDFEPTPHYIAYLDILGYEALIEERGVEEVARIIHDHVRVTKVTTRFWDLEEDDAKYIKMKIFSDNIFLCTKNNLKVLFGMVNALQYFMAGSGIFTRGVLCYADIYFNEDFVCGEGVIRAHKIESQVAIYPRIILHDTCINAAKQLCKDIAIDVLKMCFVDNDDYIIIDYLSFTYKHDVFNKKALAKHKYQILLNLTKPHSEKVLQKYLWVKNYHNKAIHKIIEEDLLSKEELQQYLITEDEYKPSIK